MQCYVTFLFLLISHSKRFNSIVRSSQHLIIHKVGRIHGKGLFDKSIFDSLFYCQRRKTVKKIFQEIQTKEGLILAVLYKMAIYIKCTVLVLAVVSFVASNSYFELSDGNTSKESDMFLDENFFTCDREIRCTHVIKFEDGTEYQPVKGKEELTKITEKKKETWRNSAEE